MSSTQTRVCALLIAFLFGTDFSFGDERDKEYPTKDLIDGEGLYRIDISIIGTTTYKTAGGASKTVLLAVPLRHVEKGIDKEKFAAVLKTPGVRAEFEARFKAEVEAEVKLNMAQQKADEIAKKAKDKADSECREKLADANLKFAEKLIQRDELDKDELPELDTFVAEFPVWSVVDEAIFRRDGLIPALPKLFTPEDGAIFALFTDDDLAKRFVERLPLPGKVPVKLITPGALRVILTELQCMGCKNVGIDPSTTP